MKKRLLATMLCLSLAASMTACGNNSSSADETTTSSNETTGDEVDFPNYSAGLNDDGFIKDIKASDYIKLAEYKGIEVDRSELAITDEDFETYLYEEFLNTYTDELEVTDRAVQDDDLVNIDYVGKIDGEEFEGGSAESYTVRIGVTQFIDDFIEQLIGHEIGETFDIEVTFPETYSNSPDLAGKDAVFTITINGISEMVYPEVTDEFVAENFESYENAETFLKEVREEFEFNEKKNYVWTKVVDASEIISYPETFIEEYVALELADLSYRAYANGTTVESLFSYYNITEEEFLESARENAKTYVKSLLCMQALCEAEGISSSFEDLQQYYGFESEESAEYIYHIYGKGYLNQVVLMHEAAGLVVENSIEIE